MPSFYTRAQTMRNAPYRQRAGLLEQAFAAACILILEGAFFPVLRPPVDSFSAALEAGSDPLARYAQLLMLVTVVTLTAIRWRVTFPVLRLAKTYGVVILFCVLTTLWSNDPLVTFRRSVSLFNCFLFGFYGYTTFGAKGFIRIIAISTVVASIGSVLLAIVAPSLALDVNLMANEVIGIKGVFAQKNELSVYSLLGLCASIYIGFLAPDRTRFDWVFRWLTIPIIGAMAMSRGVTSELACLAVIALTVRFYIGPNRMFQTAFFYGLGTLCLVLVSIFLTDPDVLFKLIGKDSTLTGRWPLWIECFKVILNRPLFGHGYGAFWDPTRAEVQYIWERIGWAAPQAHNGFIQLAIDLGLVGLAIYLTLIARLVWLTIKALDFQDLPEAKWLALFLLAMLIENADEGTLAWPDAMAMQVAFGGAITEVWWRHMKARLGGQRRVSAAHAHALRVLAGPVEPARPIASGGD